MTEHLSVSSFHASGSLSTRAVATRTLVSPPQAQVLLKGLPLAQHLLEGVTANICPRWMPPIRRVSLVCSSALGQHSPRAFTQTQNAIGMLRRRKPLGMGGVAGEKSG